MKLRTLSGALLVAPALVLAVAPAVPAGAAGDVHHAGTFSSTITSANCTPAGYFSGVSASGTWRVNVQDKKAEARFVIDLNGAPHVAFTVPMTLLDPAGATFKASTPTLAGTLVVTLTGTSFEYRIGTGVAGDTYDSTGFLGSAGAKCDYVVFHGVAS